MAAPVLGHRARPHLAAAAHVEPADDARDLDAVYRTFEQEVLPAWRDRERWLGMMQASIATAEAGFTSDRMVREYFDRLYTPADD